MINNDGRDIVLQHQISEATVIASGTNAMVCLFFMYSIVEGVNQYCVQDHLPLLKVAVSEHTVGSRSYLYEKMKIFFL
jgi:hypothetical protein